MGKQKVNHVLAVVLLLVLALGCTKVSKQDTTIEFVIRNPANGEPFVGVPVKIDEEHDGNKGITGETIFRGVTDANGRISYTFKAKMGSGYWYIPLIDETYFGDYSNWEYLARPAINWNPINKDQYNEALYEVVYYAYLKQITKNVNCEGATDTLKYHAWTPQFPGGGGHITTQVFFQGVTIMKPQEVMTAILKDTRVSSWAGTKSNGNVADLVA